MAPEQEILNLFKRQGETPLERIERFRAERPEYAGVPMTYAGRLDPMAEGVLIVLAGEARFRKEEFLAFDKEYEFEVLWGFRSDTYDALGAVERAGEPPVDLDGRLTEVLERMRGESMREYPAYSSRTVGGRPLFAWAREGSPRQAPKKSMTVSRIERVGSRAVGSEELLGRIRERIARVAGDFRQEEALSSWERALSVPEVSLRTDSFRAEVSSGTYVRSLAHSLGEEMGCGALALRIVRTRVGPYLIADSTA